MEPIDKLTSNAPEVSRSMASYVPDLELYQKLLDDAPLLTKEDKELYCEVFNALVVQLQPQSLIEWLSVRDVVDKRFEERRYQHLKLELLEHARKPPDLRTNYDEARGLESVRKCLPHLETLSRMEANCANFRRTATKDIVAVREARNSPSVVPD